MPDSFILDSSNTVAPSLTPSPIRHASLQRSSVVTTAHASLTPPSIRESVRIISTHTCTHALVVHSMALLDDTGGALYKESVLIARLMAVPPTTSRLG